MFLVTGASGFIGGHLAERLSSLGEVVGVDRNARPSYGNWNHIQGDVSEVEFPKGIEVIFHLAAEIDVRESLGNPKKVWEDNIRGTYSALEWARKRDSSFIFSSSAAVYGNPSELPLREDGELRPISPYGFSKLIGEELVSFYRETYGIPSVVLRYFNVYGPRSDHGVVYLLLKSLKEGKSFTLFGDGEQTRDFIFVSDVVEANIKAVEVKEGTFNICSGKEVSLNELISLVESLTGRTLRVIRKDRKAGEIARSVGDNKRAKEVLGWEPKVELKEGLKKTWDWLLRNFPS